MLTAVKGETPKALRDYAILLLLSQLGMRAGEVAYLHLDDIDWQEGRLHICPGKTHQERVLPLSKAVGAALADYLKHGRPKHESRLVFLKTRPPFEPFAGAAAVGEIARAALLLAGLTVHPGIGAHRLGQRDHALLLTMYNSGARVSELIGLERGQVCFSTQSYLQLTGKGRKERTIPL